MRGVTVNAVLRSWQRWRLFLNKGKVINFQSGDKIEFIFWDMVFPGINIWFRWNLIYCITNVIWDHLFVNIVKRMNLEWIFKVWSGTGLLAGGTKNWDDFICEFVIFVYLHVGWNPTWYNYIVSGGQKFNNFWRYRMEWRPEDLFWKQN